MFANLKIRTKLSILLSVFSVGLVAFGAYAYATLDAVKVGGPSYAEIAQGKDLVADILPPPEYIIEAHLLAHTMLADTSGKDLQASLGRYRTLERDFAERHAFWGEHLPKGDLRDALFVDAYAPAERYLALMNGAFVPALQAGERDKAAATLEQMSALYAQHRAAIDHAVELATARNAATEAEVAGVIDGRTSVLVALGVVVLAFGAFWSYRTARGILEPLGDTVQAMHRVATGDLTVRLDASRADELGEMSRSVNDFLAGLEQVMGEVRSAASLVTQEAEQVSSTAEYLSSGAQEQAASLEETASTMEELTSTVSQSAENARQAAALAAESFEVAERGGRVVESAVSAMAQVNSGSKRIADIITTIDEIAFQTNLLALNAAVEAARAGEQGRGFAVVAAEVRNLAGRSAEAARETKRLIDESLGYVASGTELVNRSGAGLREIVGSVRRVTDLVAEMAATTREQSNGMVQMNTAVSEIDSVTQAAAGRNEELSATAVSLSEQAKELLGMVSRFRVGGRVGASSLAPEPVAAPAVAPRPSVVHHVESPRGNRPRASAGPMFVSTRAPRPARKPAALDATA